YQLSRLSEARHNEQFLAQEREDAVLGRAAAAIAHEIRNPLNAINLGLQRLELEESGLLAEYTPLTSAMRNAVSRANTIVGDLSRFAQPLTIAAENIAIESLLKDILALYQSEAELLKIKISLTANDKQRQRDIEADPTLLAQALENICKNAIEAQPEGGFLDIRLQVCQQECQITFSNGGCTVKPADLKKITEPWFSTKTRGTGLGLALVERIIKTHNGRFTVICSQSGILQQDIFLPRRQPKS
ncbi:MAG: GHKL domain-containing protein, partial [Deltaproteobacteria bacterium]|nr:GHKL domain-containing protein [Candidatus Tharpella sp.]